ncbi:MAG: ECF transporter S component, partial [Candidatus Eremiobacteraeota bacterium]|nr:ECF transporter S component [Candidatus Eremiobacteraeota bacterium]
MQSAVRTLILLSATIALGLSPLGFVQVPGFGGAITFLHLPMILAATLESPLAAGIVGASFGVMAGLRFDRPPMEFHIVSRVLAGVAAGLTYSLFTRNADDGSKLTKASAAAAIVGTATNTLLMCTCSLMLGLAQPGQLFSVAFVHGAFEMA